MTGCSWKLNRFEPAGATALYQTVITLTLSFLVFTFGSAAGGDPDSRRPTDAADHRHDPAAQQRRPLQRRTVRVHAGVRRRCAQPAGRGGDTNWSRWSPHSRDRVHRRLPVPDRLRRAPAAAGRRRCPRRRRGHGDDQGRLSGPGDRAAAGGSRAPRTAGHAQPRGRAPRNIGNRARRRHSRRWWRWRGSTTA